LIWQLRTHGKDSNPAAKYEFSALLSGQQVQTPMPFD